MASNNRNKEAKHVLLGEKFKKRDHENEIRFLEMLEYVKSSGNFVSEFDYWKEPNNRKVVGEIYEPSLILKDAAPSPKHDGLETNMGDSKVKYMRMDGASVIIEIPNICSIVMHSRDGWSHEFLREIAISATDYIVSVLVSVADGPVLVHEGVYYCNEGYDDIIPSKGKEIISSLPDKYRVYGVCKYPVPDVKYITDYDGHVYEAPSSSYISYHNSLCAGVIKQENVIEAYTEYIRY